jgi:hypothetical protein
MYKRSYKHLHASERKKLIVLREGEEKRREEKRREEKREERMIYCSCLDWKIFFF